MDHLQAFPGDGTGGILPKRTTGLTPQRLYRLL